MPSREATITINAFSLAGSALSLVGSLYGSARPHLDVPRLVELEDAGRLDLGSLIARRYPLADINDGLRRPALRALPGAASSRSPEQLRRRQSATIAPTRGPTLPSSIHSRSV